MIPFQRQSNPSYMFSICPEKLHVAYVRCEPEVLVIGASARHVSAQHLRDLIRDLARLLLVIYGSLQTAFKDPVNKQQMDQFLKASEHLYLLKMASSFRRTKKII